MIRPRHVRATLAVPVITGGAIAALAVSILIFIAVAALT